MKILLATLVINEMEWLRKLYRQHKDWPGLVRWVFIESADRIYAEANRSLVTCEGLSTDGTSEYLADLADEDESVTYIPAGISSHSDRAQGKCASRQIYLDIAEQERPDFVFVLDADEFYMRDDQSRICHYMSGGKEHSAFTFRQRNIWRPLSISANPLFAREATGGYWGVPHCRGWRWSPGMRYASNHNTPIDANGHSLGNRMARHDLAVGTPQCIHLGFASSLNMRSAKHRYYVARGEGPDGRQWYVDCRAAFETWRPGDELPHGAKVVSYDGPIPEVFQT